MVIIDDKAIIHDPHEIRITFKSYFTEIGPTIGLASKINPPRVSFRDFITPSHTNFELIASTVDEVSKLVANLSTKLMALTVYQPVFSRLLVLLQRPPCIGKRSSRLTRRQTQLIIGQYQFFHDHDKTL